MISVLAPRLSLVKLCELMESVSTEEVAATGQAISVKLFPWGKPAGTATSPLMKHRWLRISYILFLTSASRNMLACSEVRKKDRNKLVLGPLVAH